MGEHVAGRAEERSDLAAEQVLDTGRAAAIGHVAQLRAARVADEHADEVGHRTRAGTAVRRLVGIGLGPGKEVLQRLHALGHGGPDRHHVLRVHGERDRGHVVDAVLQLLVGVRVDREHRRWREQHDAAIGRRVLQRDHAELSAGAGPVVDDDRARVRAAQLFRDLARHHIGGGDRGCVQVGMIDLDADEDQSS